MELWEATLKAIQATFTTCGHLATRIEGAYNECHDQSTLKYKK